MISPGIPDHALRFFAARLARWFELAEREPALTEVLYDGGPTVLDIGGELIVDDGSDLDDGAVLALAGNAAVYSDQVFSRDRPYLSIIVPPSWRVTFLRPPAVQRPVMAMRRLLRTPIPLGRYVETGVLANDQAAELESLVLEKRTVIISGAVGSGKTTLLRTLLGLVDPEERIVTIEDPRELALTEADGETPRRNWVALESAHGVMEMDALLRASLRLRPDRIIVGEVRGPEALELVRALNVGHDGSLFTLHSNGAQEALDRLHTLVLEGQPTHRFETVERTIDAVVQIEGRGDRRRVTEIWRPGVRS